MTDPIENVTVNQGYQLPAPTNPTAVDVERLIAAITAVDNDIALLFAAVLVRAGLNSPAFTGTPTAPTQPAGTNDNSLATTGHVQLALNAFLSEAASALETISALEAALGDADLATALLEQLGLKAPLASPEFTGIPSAPTAVTADATGQLATTAFVHAVKALVLGAPPATLDTLQKLAAAIGNNANFATDMATAVASRAPINSPTFTGTPSAPTAPLGDTSTKLATTGFVQAALGDYNTDLTTFLATKAPVDSPAFTGAPTAPTPAAGNNTTRIATTAFVTAALSSINLSAYATTAQLTTGLGGKLDKTGGRLTGWTEIVFPNAGMAFQGSNRRWFWQAADNGSSPYFRLVDESAGAEAFHVKNDGSIWCRQLGDLNARIEDRASAWGAHHANQWGNVANALASMSAGGVGSLVFAKTLSATVGFGGTIAGSSLTPTNSAVADFSPALAGTWRCLGYVPANRTASLFVRIA